jgi:predicted small metal-binding protein
MPGCNFVATGSTDDEVLSAAAEHAREQHGLTEISEELVEQARAAIRDEQASAAEA